MTVEILLEDLQKIIIEIYTRDYKIDVLQLQVGKRITRSLNIKEQRIMAFVQTTKKKMRVSQI